MAATLVQILGLKYPLPNRQDLKTNGSGELKK